MKIDKNVKNILQDAYVKHVQTRAQGARTAAAKQDPGAFDRVEISARNKEMKGLAEAAKAEPGVRKDKVDAVRETIQNGTYKVDSRLVAKGMIKDSLLDEIL